MTLLQHKRYQILYLENIQRGFGPKERGKTIFYSPTVTASSLKDEF
jgi:hypothetical protein